MLIDRCVCYEVSFETLAAVADRSGAETLEEVQREITFGHDCCRCHPYVRRMLQCGETVFSEIIGEDDGNVRASSKLEK